MSAGLPLPLQIPETLQSQLHDFRRRLWTIKLIEAGCGAVFGLLTAFLLTYALDRFWDTPAVMRLATFAIAVFGCALVPWALHRWVWRQRTPEHLARLLTRKHASIGDQLLGILELSHDQDEQARSRTLIAAAIQHVADQARRRDFRDAVPTPRHRQWSVLAGCTAAISLLLFAMYPQASANAFRRMLLPWGNIPRYTFTVPEPLPDRLVIPHGEGFRWTVPLADTTRSRPSDGEVRIGSQPAVGAQLNDGRYHFDLPPQIEPAWLNVSLGDYSRRIRLEPRLRPELSSLTAQVRLPDYLGRPGMQQKDVRNGTISMVTGSTAEFAATIGRHLTQAKINGQPASWNGATISAGPVVASESHRLLIEWQDEFGLAGREPFALSITARDDEPPSLNCEDLPRQKVVLESETLPFKVIVQDDFGVKQVGMEWRGLDESAVQAPARGERLLAAGGPERDVLEVLGTFTASTLGISPQPVAVRTFAVDYLPGRERVYSSPYVLYVLNAEQHSIWITEQLSKWHRQSLEVRDHELGLYETNKQLREMTDEELSQPEAQKRLEKQSASERANARRLSALVTSGEDLVKQASRNPEMGVGHLEKWAEMLQILKDISGSRMPSVADLLKDAAKPQASAANEPKNETPKNAGQNKSTTPPKPGAESDPPKSEAKPVPGVSDVESSQQPPEKDGQSVPPEKKNPSSPSLRLPSTSVPGTGNSKPKPTTPKARAVDDAVEQQEDLLAEFDKIAEELNRVLASLEGSTLVKRLKAAARLQNRIAVKIGEQVDGAFGIKSAAQRDPHKKLLRELGQEEVKSGRDVSFIMDDMQAYFERRRYAKFQTVLEEMRKEDVLGSLRSLADDIPKESGLSMAMAEFWSDTLDRWAEDLVDPACKGSCPGGKSKGSLPPSIVLEVLQILEGEIHLREDTRVAEQSKPAVLKEDYHAEAERLADTQDAFQERIDRVGERILELPEAEENFANEIRLLAQVSQVMREAAQILNRPETGSPAIAAETEAIELLLKSKRFNPNGGGGGGGSSPGGGGGGDTADSALALLGKGVNDHEVREDHSISQATGDSGAKLPEEFRAGLDEYFNRLEQPGKTK